ncbi:MAG: hypothetical protein ACQEWD_12410 [Bacteroidota bacterium]
MNLDKFYSLRKDFIIIGLTGRSGSGCSQIADKLTDENLISNLKYTPNVPLLKPESIKFDICYKYLKTPGNYNPFKKIVYKNVLLLHLLYEAHQSKDPIEYIVDVICQYGDGYDEYINRFGKKDDKSNITELREFLQGNISIHDSSLFENNSTNTKYDLIKFLKGQKDHSFIQYYFNDFQVFAESFFYLLNKFSITKRTRFLHDISINLRKEGRCLQFTDKPENNLNNIYLIAETINRLIKLTREKDGGKARIVIDSLKNSLELMYFKEKYSGFYMVAVNKEDEERKKYLKSILNSDFEEVIKLDDAEYEGGQVNKGTFTVPDIENCIQKSEYHIFHSKSGSLESNREMSVDYQLVKFLSLISQPGIITPTALERTMQVAYNAKYNSGCISRQVGAVITDENFTVKSIGWNDVAQNQMPCKLRNAVDLSKGSNSELFSNYEREGGNFKTEKGRKTFKELFSDDVEKVDLEKLKGRNCSFCFKSFQNTYEYEKNQVHTRSLHAEENAMMQISKYGGNGLKNGFLFTTASPCELCSKKAFQLGIKEIFYIDPYPGIARKHTLKNGINGEGEPNMTMFQGAVGRLYHKLYEPFMSEKDELKILSGFKPIERVQRKEKKEIKEEMNTWNIGKEEKEKISEILEGMK